MNDDYGMTDPLDIFELTFPDPDTGEYEDEVYFYDLETCAEIEYQSETLYDGGPFERLVKMSSKPKGAMIEMLVQEFLEEFGHVVRKASNSSYDRLVDNIYHAEIKGSSMWKDSGETFTWQQIRLNEPDWDCVFFVAIYYDCIDIYYETRTNLEDSTIYPPSILQGQHNGQAAQDTWWLKNCTPDDFPTWQWVGRIVG